MTHISSVFVASSQEFYSLGDGQAVARAVMNRNGDLAEIIVSDADSDRTENRILMDILDGDAVQISAEQYGDLKAKIIAGRKPTLILQ